jgi:hypothetical protein
MGQKRRRGRPVKYSAVVQPHTVTLPESDWKAWQAIAQEAGLSVSEVMVHASRSPQFRAWVARLGANIAPDNNPLSGRTERGLL